MPRRSVCCAEKVLPCWNLYEDVPSTLHESGDPPERDLGLARTLQTIEEKCSVDARWVDLTAFNIEPQDIHIFKMSESASQRLDMNWVRVSNNQPFSIEEMRSYVTWTRVELDDAVPQRLLEQI